MGKHGVDKGLKSNMFERLECMKFLASSTNNYATDLLHEWLATVHSSLTTGRAHLGQPSRSCGCRRWSRRSHHRCRSSRRSSRRCRSSRRLTRHLQADKQAGVSTPPHHKSALLLAHSITTATVRLSQTQICSVKCMGSIWHGTNTQKPHKTHNQPDVAMRPLQASHATCTPPDRTSASHGTKYITYEAPTPSDHPNPPAGAGEGD